MKIINETELMNNQKASTVIVPDKQFEALQTAEGNSLMFSIATENILYCTREVPGDTHGWVKVDLSSSLSAACYGGAAIKAETFDIAQDMTSTNTVDIALVVSCNGTYYLHLVTGFTNTFANWSSNAPLFDASSQYKFDYPGDNISTYQAMPVNDVQILDSNDGNGTQYIIADLISNTDTQTISRFYVDVTKARGYAWLPHDLSSDLQAGKITTFVGCGPNDGPDSYPGAGDGAGNNIGGAYVLGSVAGKPQLQYTPAYNFDHPEETPNPTVFNFPAGTNDTYMAMDVSCPAGSTPYTDLFFATNGQLYFLACTVQNDSGNSKPTPVSIYTHDLFQNIQSLHVKNWNDNIVIWGQSLDPADMQTSRLFIMEGVAGQETNANAWSCPIPLLINVVNSSAYVNNIHSLDSIIDQVNGNAYGSCNVLFAEQVIQNADNTYTSVLMQLFQDPITTAWQQRSLLTAPTSDNIMTEIHDTTTYSTHIEITDDYNTPQINVPVAIWVSSPTSVYVNDFNNTDAYSSLDTQKPLLLQTDISGNVTIMQPVDTIGGISYYVAVQDPVTKQIYTEVINPLSGTSGSIATLNSKVPDGNKDYLQGVQVADENGNQTLLVSSSYNSSTASTSNNINTICQQNAHMNADGLVTNQSWPNAATVAAAFVTTQSVSVSQPTIEMAVKPGVKKRVNRKGVPAAKNRAKQFAKADRPFKGVRFNSQTDKIWGWTYGKNAAHYEGIEAVKTMGVMLNTDGSLSLESTSLLGSGLHFEAKIGHIVKWMKSEAHKLEKAVITFTNGVVDCVLTIAGDFYHFVAKCANDIVNLVHTVLNAIETAFADIVKWIGFIFEYKDILRTHTVTANILKVSIEHAASNMSSFKANISQSFTTIVNDLNQLVGLPQLPDTQQSSSKQSPSPSFSKTPQSQWGTHKLKSNGQNTNCKSFTPENLDDSIIGGLMSTLQNFINNEKSTFTQLQTNFKSIIDSAHTLTVTQIMEQVLVAIADFFVDEIEDLILALVDVVAALLVTAYHVMTSPIEIPVISWLYGKISGGAPFTLLDMCCLVTAIPATIVYKLAENEAPFSQGDLAQQLSSAPDLTTVQNILTKPLSSFTTGVGAHGGSNALNNTAFDIAVKVANISAMVGAVGTSVCTYLKSGVITTLKDNRYINTANTAFYMLYVWPDLLASIDGNTTSSEWYVDFNNWCTWLCIGKVLTDGIVGYYYEFLPVWSPMSPWADLVINTVWEAPTNAAFYYAYKKPFKNSDQLANGIIELVGGNFFDFSGILSPVLAAAQADYIEPDGKIAITAAMAPIALFNLVWGTSCILDSYGPFKAQSN